MEVLDVNYRWNGALSSRSKTDAIVVHHRVGDGDVMSIHNGHIKKGWVGIGYHFYVRKDGSIYRGRPIERWELMPKDIITIPSEFALKVILK